MDAPEWDGAAASALISFLGGTGGHAWADAAHTIPTAAPDWVAKDAVDHAGIPRSDDPRVGMFGTSYGGGVQFATAKVDKRLDAIVPIATWNDLRYSLYPNAADRTTGVTSSTPGVTKSTWGLGLLAFGILKVTDGPLDPYRTLGCPNLTPGACEALLTGTTLGYPTPQAQSMLAASSVATYADQIDVPTLLIQGEDDTLFGLEEAVATFDALRAAGTPVKMIWTSGGHSGPAIDDEVSFDHPNPQRHCAIARVLDWYDHYLRDSGADTGPDFAYFRPWESTSADPAAAYAEITGPEPTAYHHYYLSGGGLSEDPAAISGGWQTFLTGQGAIPTTIMLPVSGSGPGAQYGDVSLPGTFARYSGPALGAPLQVAGMPRLTLSIACPGCLVTSVDPTGMLTLYAKVYDLAPDGTRVLIAKQVGAARISDLTRLNTLVLPGIVHQFDSGHRVVLEIAGTDPNHRGSLVPQSATLFTGDPAQLL